MGRVDGSTYPKMGEFLDCLLKVLFKILLFIDSVVFWFWLEKALWGVGIAKLEFLGFGARNILAFTIFPIMLEKWEIRKLYNPQDL